MPSEKADIITLSQNTVSLLRIINSIHNCSINDLKKYVPTSIVDSLLKQKLIIESTDYNFNYNILNDLEYDYPLSSLVIELTNACNLSCSHCYGQFGHPSQKSLISYEDIIKLKKQLDLLHTIEVRISGGECLLNPDFHKIVLFFLENGFRVGIYTNCYAIDKLKEFIDKTYQYHYYLAISLDGMKETHDKIRGKKGSFDNVISILDYLKSKSNIEVLIETALSKDNYKTISKINSFVSLNYPSFEHKAFAISPFNGCKNSLSYKELISLKQSFPQVFDEYFTKGFRFLHHKRHRCMGGVINGVLTADGDIKSCPIANDKVFVLGNIKEKSLIDIWNNPSGDTSLFRNEYIKTSQQCKRCSFKRKCGNKNCRVEAMTLTGNWRNANPYTCMVVKEFYD